MKITADNRGRIALGKLDRMVHLKMGVSHLPGSEWDVEYRGEQLIVKPWREEPKSEWVKTHTIHPEHIGQTIWMWTHEGGVLPRVETSEEANKPKGVCGELDGFFKDADGMVREVKMKGLPHTTLEGDTVFWVKA